MERSNEYEDVAAALAEVRTAPRAGFAAELDELVAAGFPRKSRLGRLQAISARVRGLSPQRLLIASGATALVAIAIATAVISSTGPVPAPIALEQHATRQTSGAGGVQSTKQSSGAGGVQYSEALPQVAAGPVESSSAAGRYESSGGSFSPEALSSPATGQALRDFAHRDIERSAEIGLLADPADIAGDSARVFSAVHDARGIVLRSTTTAGRNAGAHFDLLIPSTRLGDALAAFSAIDEVRSRHEATADITKPTVTVGEELRGSRARIDSLLAQLAEAEVESEQEAIEAELRGERHHAARLRSQAARLHQRADFSRVSLRIEAGPSSETSSGGWGIADAWDDAGHILAIAAGVTVIGLAVIAPLALIVLLAWLAHRLWLRARRERALDT
jgi:hypothetical protein